MCAFNILFSKYIQTYSAYTSFPRINTTSPLIPYAKQADFSKVGTLVITCYLAPSLECFGCNNFGQDLLCGKVLRALKSLPLAWRTNRHSPAVQIRITHWMGCPTQFSDAQNVRHTPTCDIACPNSGETFSGKNKNLAWAVRVRFPACCDLEVCDD